MIMLPITGVDENNILVTNAVASVINSAFETGIAPENYHVKSLNEGGFLDAAFADSDMDTPSGKPAKADWTIVGKLEGYKWTTLTPKLALERWVAYAGNRESNEFSRTKVGMYLTYLAMLSNGFSKDSCDDFLMNMYEPDGVHDDFMAQVAFAEDVVYG